ncbi:disulfide bond formation protein B [Salibaculum sp.]|jgi:disulfide bond formation protein DsbB|uniref:disulfide bond formation protein B n=1 Tax=Salibaculum sp. TaxID=2855480 RepID=UPI002B488FD6|nr:disulfide bond formation protein B [Salibaculum sp.]HKL70524.1 disulfide bond formation protein B [Salibaculum sp.]
MTRTQLTFLAAGGSFALLAGAFLFQALGYPPCTMCLWQRWPHAAAIVIGALALVIWRPATPLLLLGALAAATTGGIGVFHTGVERGWWDGPASCTGSDAGLGSDLLSTDIAPVVLCDEVVWSLLGLSMASYNALISFALAALWVWAARR